MSDEQPTSWRERFFGTRPEDTADEATAPPADATADGPARSEADAEVASTSVAEHDDHQPLVEHEPAADTAVLDEQPHHGAGHDAGHHDGHHAHDDGSIEPTVIAPSSLRGPSHSAAHPDDSHADRASSLEQPADEPADGPPALVEPRRPSFGLRRQTDPEDASAADADAVAAHDADQRADAARADGDRDHDRADHDRDGGTATAPLAAAGAGAAGGIAAAAASRRQERSEREFVEPEPTQAIDQQRADEPTQAIGTQRADAGDDRTRVLDAQPEQRTERFGIVRDGASIPVDDETGRAAAAGGTPIVLVEEPQPPRRKGARGVGFAVALLAAVIFAALFAAAFFAVGYLFDRDFDALQTAQDVWLRPSWLLPVIVFFVAYWLVTLIVNRAGWWAHVLGAFIVAILVYAAHIGGAYMEELGGWGEYASVPGIAPQELGQLLLAPLSVLAFVIAREVPVWVGGIVARRGRRAREWNRQANDDFQRENAERLEAYERSRG